jgi:hypothetical protein
MGTWFHPPTQRWYVKDYTMCSRSLMCGVSNCKVFTNVCPGNSNHRLLAANLQLCMRVLPWVATFGGMWDATILWDKL